MVAVLQWFLFVAAGVAITYGAFMDAAILGLATVALPALVGLYFLLIRLRVLIALAAILSAVGGYGLGHTIFPA